MSGWREDVVDIDRTSPLVGIRTRPASDDGPERPTIVLLNAGILHHVGPNRLHVLAARRFAEAGYTTLRFDFSGLGDSARREQALERREAIAHDTQDIFDHARSRWGTRSFVCMGLCAGADNALRAAVRDPDVHGVVLLDASAWRTKGWQRRHLSRAMGHALTHPGTWPRRFRRLIVGEGPEQSAERPEQFRSGYLHRDEMAPDLRTLIERGVELCWIFTGAWDAHINATEQLFELFPDVTFPDGMTLIRRAEADHTFSAPAERAWLLDQVVEWLARFEGAVAAQP